MNNGGTFKKNVIADVECRRRLAAAYRIILDAAMQKRETQEKQTPKSGKFDDLTNSGAETQAEKPENMEIIA